MSTWQLIQHKPGTLIVEQENQIYSLERWNNSVNFTKKRSGFVTASWFFKMAEKDPSRLAADGLTSFASLTSFNSMPHLASSSLKDASTWAFSTLSFVTIFSNWAWEKKGSFGRL